MNLIIAFFLITFFRNVHLTPLDLARVKRALITGQRIPNLIKSDFQPEPQIPAQIETRLVPQQSYQPPLPVPASPYQGFDDRQFQAKNEEYKKTADIYLKEFSENSKIMTNSLKKIEDLVVEVLNDQNQQKLKDESGRYKRAAYINDQILKFIRRKRDSPVEEPSFVDNLNMEVKVVNKNNQDLWDVSEFLLDEGIRKSILEAIKQDLHLTDQDDLKGIDQSIKASFQKIRDEAAHVDVQRSDRGSEKSRVKHDVISVNVPLVLKQNE